METLTVVAIITGEYVGTIKKVKPVGKGIVSLHTFSEHLQHFKKPEYSIDYMPRASGHLSNPCPQLSSRHYLDLSYMHTTDILKTYKKQRHQPSENFFSNSSEQRWKLLFRKKSQRFSKPLTLLECTIILYGGYSP